MCLLDGDKRNEAGYAALSVTNGSDTAQKENIDDIVYGPGDSSPEKYIFDAIVDNLDIIGNLLGKLSIALLLDTSMQDSVRQSIMTRSKTNHDRHNVFAQVGEDLDFLAENVVKRAFINTWANAFPEEVSKIWDPAAGLLPTP
jgi:hypothetical protein